MRFIMNSVFVLATVTLSVAITAPQAQSNSSADNDRLSIQTIASGNCTGTCDTPPATLIPSNTRYLPGFKPTKSDLPTSTSTSSSISTPDTSGAPTRAEVAKGFGKAKTVTVYLAQTVYKVSTVTTTKMKTKTVSVVNGTAAATEYSADTSDGWSFDKLGMLFGGLAGFNVALVMVVFL